MKKILIILSLLLSVPLCHAMTLNSMTKDEVMNMFQDKTLTTIPLSTIENKLVADRISIYFSKDGQAIGHLAVKPKSDPQNDAGTWNVQEDGALCITWKQWFNAKPFCDYVFDTKNSVMFYDDAGFVSLGLKKDIQNGNIMQVGKRNST